MKISIPFSITTSMFLVGCLETDPVTRFEVPRDWKLPPTVSEADRHYQAAQDCLRWGESGSAPRRAVEELMAGAKLDDPRCIRTLAMCLESGYGAKKDTAGALQLYRQSAARKRPTGYLHEGG